MSDLFIGIDSGTQGTKTVIFDAASGEIIAESRATYPLIEGLGGRKEQDPERWLDAVFATIKDVLAQDGVEAQHVRGIGVSGQQHGMVALDAQDRVIRPAKLWCDTETTAEADALTEKLGGLQRTIERIGNAIAVGYTASKILWLQQHEPHNYDKIATILLPHDYINFRLTGEKKAEYGDASGTAYFDIRTRRYADAVLKAIDASGNLRQALPPLIAADEPVGTLLPQVAQKLGLNAEVVVSSGGGDNMMAAIGTGNVTPGVVTASLGTSGTIYSFSEHPVVDANGELAAFCSSDGHWLPLACTMNVTVATELTRNLFGYDVAELNRRAEQAPVGAEGVLLLPYFNGERTPPLPNATATLAGLTAMNDTPENICRAAMEGATFGMRYALEVLQRNGIEPDEIRLVGGGSKSALWRQVVADIFGYPVVCPKEQEAGALGAALQALWCYRRAVQGEKVALPEITEHYVALDENTRKEPNNERSAFYKALYGRYTRLNATLLATYDSK